MADFGGIRMKALGAVAFWIVAVAIGLNTCDFITSPNTINSPPSPSISPVSPAVPAAPALPPTPIPGSVPTPSKELPPSAVNLPTAIRETRQSRELVSANYSWTYRGEWDWEMKIPASLYDYYRALPRAPTKNFSVYVTHPLDDPYINLLVDKLKKAAQQEGFSEYETVEFVTAFVQGLPYTVDSVTTPYDEYPRYPLETLIDKGGDCEDTSILLASMIDRMGYGVVLINLPNHLGVGVKGGENTYGTYWEYEGSKYFYVETTGENWGIGELPEQYRNVTASVHPLVPVPILTFDGSIKGSGYFAEVEVIVSNLGSAPAYDVSVLGGFDAGSGMVWNSQENESFALGIGQKATVRLNLRIPLGEHTRLIIQILIDGVPVDEGYSNWFDT